MSYARQEVDLMMKYTRAAYAAVSRNLTKVIGAVGASLMSLLAFVDPPTVRAAAQEYLGDHAAAKISVVLFILVIARGVYTGIKAQHAADALAAAKAAPAEIAPVKTTVPPVG